MFQYLCIQWFPKPWILFQHLPKGANEIDPTCITCMVIMCLKIPFRNWVPICLTVLSNCFTQTFAICSASLSLNCILRRRRYGCVTRSQWDPPFIPFLWHEWRIAVMIIYLVAFPMIACNYDRALSNLQGLVILPYSLSSTSIFILHTTWRSSKGSFPTTIAFVLISAHRVFLIVDVLLVILGVDSLRKYRISHTSIWRFISCGPTVKFRCCFRRYDWRYGHFTIHNVYQWYFVTNNLQFFSYVLTFFKICDVPCVGGGPVVIRYIGLSLSRNILFLLNYLRQARKSSLSTVTSPWVI